MAKKIPGWLKICGIGCGLIVVASAVLVAGSFLVFRDALRGFESADEAFRTLAERYGPIADYRPPAAGSIEPERIEIFLAVREAFEPARDEAEEALSVLSAGEGLRGRGLIKSWYAIGLAHKLPDLHARRNDALLEAGMGLGEYYYLYTVAFYSWLRKSPADGPSFKMVGERGYVFERIESVEEPVVREDREERTRTSLNRLLLPVLRNQLLDLADIEADADLAAWQERLSGEIAALEADSRRLPWEEGLPDVVASSLLPYRDRLERSYGVMCNALEAGVVRRSLPSSERGDDG